MAGAARPKTKAMALKELNIRNFAIIKKLEIELDDGLTVITGETGAGKSIVLGALNLLLGSRAESSMVRHGEDQCEISALFDVSKLASVKSWLQERDLQEEYESANGRDNKSYCLIRRIVRTDKPTKCYINDQPTTLASLKEIGALLVDLHGQHEHQSLLRKTTQRQIIDQFADHDDALQAMARMASKIRRLENELATVTGSNTDAGDRMDLLSFQINELVEAQLIPGEFDSLVSDQARLANTEVLQGGIQTALDALHLNDEHNVSTDLGNQIISLQALSEVNDDLLPVVEQLNLALSQIEDSKAEMESALARVESDPQRLQELDQRMELLINLARKHRCTEAELIERLDKLQLEYARLEGLKAAPEKLQAQIEREKDQYYELAGEISDRRQQVATKLSASITAQMQELGMRGGRLEIQVEPQIADDIVVSENGIDHIDYLVSSNHGLPLQALGKTASGGELSRISLAIQVITSEHAHTPTLVFDEVDVGVGGKVAGIVGERLSELGENAQVLCITHLPQVASQGQHHFTVDKVSSSYETYSTLLMLDKTQRIEEIARMLGGKEVTDQTRAHAAEMLSHSQAQIRAAS